ncbi:Piso0_002074 [Millerozyma farinosa CBS 7064]|uniref:Piso0_002074 protein n=1 Tax=Pichia sorbitophila (strain ATCC MYA-4447 / BCRC 22081 / CBS 7064 / NBRC 10061 / NRRL Y-12695) TaxID=559304 RepID=G8YBM0_PICSO|nr:Piso0_002074 [Millerozyma farinosa CBS 7064]
MYFLKETPQLFAFLLLIEIIGALPVGHDGIKTVYNSGVLIVTKTMTGVDEKAKEQKSLSTQSGSQPSFKADLADMNKGIMSDNGHSGLIQAASSTSAYIQSNVNTLISTPNSQFSSQSSSPDSRSAPPSSSYRESSSYGVTATGAGSSSTSASSYSSYSDSGSSSSYSSKQQISSAASSYSKVNSSASSSSSSKASVSSSATVFSVSSDPSGSFDSTLDTIWERFWSSDKGAWTDNDQLCQSSYKAPVVWTEAVVGKTTTLSGSSQRTANTVKNLMQYENTDLKVFSSGTGGDDDIYTDDNAQVAWVFIDAYQITGNDDYLQTAKNIVSFLKSQWDSNGIGGVYWHYKNKYIASISTVEAALASVLLYDITKEESDLSFAEECMNFMFQHFQDKDKLFFDGFNNDTYDDMNKGKLTYTVGVGMSTLAHLNKHTGNDTWLQNAVALGQASIDKSGPFYSSEGYWNNALEYVHLLFKGFSDLLTIAPWQNDFNEFKAETIKQAAYIYSYFQDPDDKDLYFSSPTATQTMQSKFNSIFHTDKSLPSDQGTQCHVNDKTIVKKSLMDNASAGQILYFASHL